MTLKVDKKERETSQRLVKRFSAKVRRSGILKRARRAQFRSRSKSERIKREEALRREEIIEKRKILEKLGKLERKMTP